MFKRTIPLALVAALAVTAPTSAAKGVRYVGKTSSGHKVTFTKKGKNIHRMTAGIRMSCLPIQGGGAPMTGAEIWSFTGHVPAFRHVKFSSMAKPAFHYNEVTWHLEMKSRRTRGGGIRGRLRAVYEFLIPKYPIGTFSIYSCAGGATFKAKPVG
jgi:hypothetical protein